MKGRVKWWSKEKGCGFIECDQNESFFAHIDNKDQQSLSIEENQEIEFTLEKIDSSLFLKLTPYEQKA